MVYKKIEDRKGVVICGPTASGKTSLAIELCEKFNGEIISADSRQVYRYMDIGTGKPSKEERERVKHYLIDIIDPNKWFDAGRFIEMADEAYEKIVKKGKIPFIVGGTGLYIRALERGLVPSPPVSEELRTYLRNKREREGTEVLYRWLKEVDPESAEKIHPRDYPRIERALIYFLQTGKKFSEAKRSHAFSERRYNFIKLYIDVPRPHLYFLIENRVYDMIKKGWMEEVKRLLEMGYGEDSPGFASIGYRELAEVLKGGLEFDEAVRVIVKRTKEYARRQIIWFRKEDVIKIPPEVKYASKIIERFCYEVCTGF